MFGVFYHLIVIYKTTNVKQSTKNGLKCIAMSVPDAYPPALYFIRAFLRHSVHPMWTKEVTFCEINTVMIDHKL